MEEIIKALILGILQGITEFLPISSSGHLVLFSEILNFHSADETSFNLVLHVATALSIVFVFRRDIKDLFIEFASGGYRNHKNYIYILLVSTTPLLSILPIKNNIEVYFDGNVLLTSVGFLITAFLLFIIGYKKFNTNKKININSIDSLIIGMAQLVALIPGISRSGATISMGILLGIKKTEAARFSFLMLIAPLLFAGIYEVISSRGAFSAESSFPILLIGFLSAFITGVIACRFIIRLVSSSKLHYFSYYLLGASLVSFMIYLL